MQTKLKHGIKPFWVQGTQLVPSSCTLVGFAIGAPCLVHTPLKYLFWEANLWSNQNFFPMRIYDVLGPQGGCLEKANPANIDMTITRLKVARTGRYFSGVLIGSLQSPKPKDNEFRMWKKFRSLPKVASQNRCFRGVCTERGAQMAKPAKVQLLGASRVPWTQNGWIPWFSRVCIWTGFKKCCC